MQMKAMIRSWAVRLLALAALLCPTLASAASCTVLSTSLIFGSYASPGGALVDSTATITVTCLPDLILLACKSDYSIALSQGGQGSYSPRKMAFGANRMDYNLFSDSGRATVWGDGTGSTSVVPGSIASSVLGLICLSGLKNHTVYGRIPANQNIRAGAYTDSITVTVTF